MVFLIQELSQLLVSFLCTDRFKFVTSTFNFSLEHHDHQESDDKRVPMVNLKNPKKKTKNRQHTNQGKRNHTKWIESNLKKLPKQLDKLRRITQSGLKVDIEVLKDSKYIN